MKRKTALIFVILSLIALSLFVSCTKKADDSLTPGPYPNPSYDKLEEDEEAEKENEPSEEAVELFEDYKHIAFTFDDGPDAILTKKFVDKLAHIRQGFRGINNPVYAPCLRGSKHFFCGDIRIKYPAFQRLFVATAKYTVFV